MFLWRSKETNDLIALLSGAMYTLNYLNSYQAMGRFSSGQTDEFFSNFSQNIRFDISYKLSPKETICMKCQILFSTKKKKKKKNNNKIFQNVVC